MPNRAKQPKWREEWAGKVCTPEDFLRFLDEVGCCTRSPLVSYPDFPNQAEVLGPVPRGVSDPWFWKDDLHAEKRLYYTRVLGGEPTFISNEMLPAFVATNGAVYDEMVFDGLLTQEAQQIYKLIESSGPIPIRDLKRLLTPDAKRSSDRVLIELDRVFLITKTGITGRTRGTYGFIWDLVERWMPDVLSEADALGRKNGTEAIRERLSRLGASLGVTFYERVLAWSA